FGNYSLAHQLCHQALEASSEYHVSLAHCAKALVEAGDLAQAEALAAKLDRLRPDDTLSQRLHLPLIRSAIETRRGNGVKAVDLLAAASRYEQGESQVLYHRAQAYLAAGEHEKAVAEFERLLSHRGWFDWPAFAPLSQLGLARAYAARGDNAKARISYEQFFAAWNAADPGTPTLLRAKAEYKKLTSLELASVPQ